MEGIGRLFAAFYALSYPSILKLEAVLILLPHTVSATGLTKRPSPSIKTTIYGFRFCVCVPCQSRCLSFRRWLCVCPWAFAQNGRCPSGCNHDSHQHGNPPCMFYFPYIERPSRIRSVIASFRTRGERRWLRRGRPGSCAARPRGDSSPDSERARGPGSIIEYPTAWERRARVSCATLQSTMLARLLQRRQLHTSISLSVESRTTIKSL